MGRNYRRNAYPNPRIPKDGALWYYLQADAQYTGIPVSELMKMRLLQWYEQRVYQRTGTEQEQESSPGKREPAHSRASANALTFLQNE